MSALVKTKRMMGSKPNLEEHEGEMHITGHEDEVEQA